MRRGERRGALDVDEQDGGLARLAAELDAVVERASGDVLAHVSAEQVAQALALAQSGQPSG